jgi:signal transduction histidine kinase
LSPEDIARLFGRFQRLSAKPTGGETSTGLGLSIVKRIVDLHGGTVVAETTSPSGTTFKIAIPSA